ncbi:MAG: ATP-grasp domain-containing protein [Gemmataceae bacterium]
MKVTILADLYEDDSHDPSVDQVADALRDGGHAASVLLVADDLKALTSGLARRKPDLVFHMIHDFGGESGLIATAAVIDALKIPYTGGGPGELFIRGNKHLAKKILAYEKLKCPDFAVFSKDATLETGGNLRMPLIVKPMERDGSIGISGNALVRGVPELMERVLAIHRDVDDSALAEEYVEGREFYVGVLGNREPVAFPPIEMDFTGLPEGAPRVLDYKAKWEKGSAEFQGTKAVLPDLPDELKARLQKVALDACRALLVRDYARVDMRLTDTQDIYVIEVNANCDLERSSEFATAALAAGLDYPTLINRIAELAIERRRPAAPRAGKSPTNGKAGARKVRTAAPAKAGKS